MTNNFNKTPSTNNINNQNENIITGVDDKETIYNEHMVMEYKARKYLKTLPNQILVFSTFLVNSNFDEEPLNNILDKIWYLYYYCIQSKLYIDDYNQRQERILQLLPFLRLLPKRALPQEVYSDYKFKKLALDYILADDDVRYFHDNYAKSKLVLFDSKSKGSR